MELSELMIKNWKNTKKTSEIYSRIIKFKLLRWNFVRSALKSSLLDYLIQASLNCPAHVCHIIVFKEMMMIISSDNTFHSLSALRPILSWSVFIVSFQKYFATS